MGKKDKKPKPKPKPVPKPPSPTVSSSDNDVISASSSHDDATHKTNPSPPPKPKPTTTSKQPTVVAGLPALSSKRPSTTAPDGSEKKPKKQKSNEPGPICWTNDHDIILLKGLVDYKSNNDGIDPMSDIQHLYDFIKPSFNLPDLDKGIIVNKVQHFKSKFRKPHSKKHPSPHETHVFDLSTLIWGRNNHLHAIEENDNKMAVDRTEEIEKVINVGFGFSKEEGVMLKEAMKGLEGEKKDDFIREVRKANVAFLDAYCSTLKLLELAARKITDNIRNHHF